MANDYFTDLNIFEYDQTIANHPIIEQMLARIAYRLLEHLDLNCNGKTVLDAGCGSGLITRFLKGIPGLQISACDIDPKVERFYKDHPELRDVTLFLLDLIRESLPTRYHVIISSGLYHHIPKRDRPYLIRNMFENCNFLIIADEGIQEYTNENERLDNCKQWYSFVIEEARRRQLTRLAEMEACFWSHEYLATADDGLDFKESPSHLVEDSRIVGLSPCIIDRIGPWASHGGGFYVACFTNKQGTR